MEENMTTEAYLQFIRDRITQLRLKEDMSEYKLSLAIGCNQGHINKITTGRTNPSMEVFLKICDYFRTDPSCFFDPRIDDPTLFNEAVQKLKRLNEKDKQFILTCIDRCLEE